MPTGWLAGWLSVVVVGATSVLGLRCGGRPSRPRYGRRSYWPLARINDDGGRGDGRCISFSWTRWAACREGSIRLAGRWQLLRFQIVRVVVYLCVCVCVCGWLFRATPIKVPNVKTRVAWREPSTRDGVDVGRQHRRRDSLHQQPRWRGANGTGELGAGERV